MDAFTLLLVLIVVVFVAAGAYFLGRRTTSGPAFVNTGTERASESAIEIARLQEREKTLTADIVRQATEIHRLNEAAMMLHKDRAESRERAATAEERAAGLQQALSSERKNNEASRTALMADLTSAKEARDRLQISHAEASQKLASAAQMEQELRSRLRQAEDRVAQHNGKIGTLEELLTDCRAQIAEKDRALSAFSEKESVLNRALAERAQQFRGIQEHLKSEFENIANKVLAATASQLSEKSQDRLIAILDPLKTRLTEIQHKVESSHLEDTRQRAALGEQIRQAAQISQAIGLEAQNLAKALKGDSQTRAQWGEMRLERILEKSGLERGKEFQIHGGDFNAANAEDQRQRPDVVILLPEGRHFVIDSKMPLIDYLEYEAADSDESRTKALHKLLASVRAHIDDLAAKNYQYADAINSHDLVFMFIPIEGVTALVLRTDESIFDYAWNRKIVITSPSTLFMTMRTVGSIWRYERQSKNAQAIFDQAGELYDRLVGVVGDLNDAGQKIQAAGEAHNEAMKRLATGRGNALSRAEKLKSLGVPSKQKLPAILLDGSEHVVTADDDEPATLVERARRKLERPNLS